MPVNIYCHRKMFSRVQEQKRQPHPLLYASSSIFALISALISSKFTEGLAGSLSCSSTLFPLYCFRKERTEQSALDATGRRSRCFETFRRWAPATTRACLHGEHAAARGEWHVHHLHHRSRPERKQKDRSRHVCFHRSSRRTFESSTGPHFITTI